MAVRRVIGVFVAVSVVLFAASAMAGVLVSADWVKGHLEDAGVVVVDVQNKHDSYEKGHIPGAVKVDRHVDLEDYTRYPTNKYPQREQFVQLMSRLGIGNNTTVVVYDDQQGIFASRMLFIMELYGHDSGRLKLLDGGMKAWQAKGYPLATEPGKARLASAYATSGPAMGLLVSWQEIYRDIVQKQNPGAVLHDARPAAEYAGQKVRAIRGGHIPGSVNVTGVDAANNKEDHAFKAPAEIRKAFEDAGITPEKTVYTYCHSSDRGAHAYVVLKHLLGYRNVRVYDGAWSEWAVMTALPAEQEKWLALQNTGK